MSRLGVALLVLAACTPDNQLDRIKQAPLVDLISPEEGALLHQGEPIVLEGRVQDEHDLPPELDVSWVIDEGQAVSASAGEDGTVTLDLTSEALSIGTHEAVLTALDTDGQSAQASVRFDVAGPLSAPTVTILDPDDGAAWEPDLEVTFRGQANDLSTPADDLVFGWSSDLQGALSGAVSGDGQSILITDVLEIGTHAVTLTATDLDGESGSATIHVTVEETKEEADPGDVVFSEMMINPQVVDDEVGEWVELYNTSGSTLDLGGYTFRDDDYDTYVLVGPMIVAAHDWFVLCANTDEDVNGGVPCDGVFLRDSTGLGLALANGPDEVVLTRPDGVEIDWLHYDDNWFDAAVAIGVDPAYMEEAGNDVVDHWCPQTTVVSSGGEPGTPGMGNDACD